MLPRPFALLIREPVIRPDLHPVRVVQREHEATGFDSLQGLGACDFAHPRNYASLLGVCVSIEGENQDFTTYVYTQGPFNLVQALSLYCMGALSR
jgi:hypothetical protein